MSAMPQREIAPEPQSDGAYSKSRLLLLQLGNLALFAAAYLAAYGCSRFFAQRTGTRLWIPDAVLLCTLLLVPRKKWWLYVLMTVPIRFVPAVRAPIGAWFLWLTWTNDVTKGLLTAHLLQYAIGNPIRLNNVRRYATYLGIAVVLAPMLSGVFGALLRHLALGHAFWTAFGQWSLGDALANLVVTPALLLWLSREYQGLRPRLFEAILWGIGFAFCLYSEMLFDGSILAIYAPFPFLVWAALRLGTIGASSGLFLTTVFLILAISRHKGPFFYLIAHDMHFLQLFLAVLALPIMFVAILFEERQQAEARLLKSQEELNQNYKRIRDLTGRLIHSQEEERSKIARELHDGLAQQFTLLALGLDRLERMPADQLALAHGEVVELRRQTDEVAFSVREVARQSHSTILQHLGLPNALKALCRTFAQQYQMTVDLEAEPLENLGDDISLCLFRVTQEALNNAVTHGHANKITVVLARDADFICLRIKDTGIGFETAAKPEGLGLVSMQERLRLVGGKLAIRSSPEGTVVEATVDCSRQGL
ncbi:MAG TPA: MASE1 domain-containing protein [Verrucomicrobiae bacterium]|nr:MASE1 domain-containing protein [Verrucomicrobiae bacterium]